MKLQISHSFPLDIIREILLKVATVKSLLRCKSVCKEWYSLISDQHFIKTHYILSSTNINYEHHRLIYIHDKRDINLNSCPLYDVLFDESVNNAIQLENPLHRTHPSRALTIVGSCNGLVCILVEDDNTLFIYNPSTRKTNVLPGCEQEACEFWLFHGFGYDETTHDYKVVRLWCCDRTYPYSGTMLYSLKTHSWKEIGRFPSLDLFTDGKFLNGALHWATGDVWSDSRDIVSLDLWKETYCEVLQPDYNEGSKRLTLGVLGQWLCVLCNYRESREVDLWVMKVYGVKDSWTKLACITYETDIWWDKTLDPLCISNDGKLLLKFGLKLIVYDLKDSSSTMIDNFDRCNCVDACIVVESLVSPFPSLGLADNNDDEN